MSLKSTPTIFSFRTMFLFHHALVVDMLVDFPPSPSFAPIVGVRGSVFAKHITRAMLKPFWGPIYVYTWAVRGAIDGSFSSAAWSLRHDDWHMLNSMMWIACEHGHRAFVEMIITKGADTWNWGLWWACKGGHRGLVKLMIDKGANEWNGGLRRACRGGHREIAKLMIEMGADLCQWCVWEKASGRSHTVKG